MRFLLLRSALAFPGPVDLLFVLPSQGRNWSKRLDTKLSDRTTTHLLAWTPFLSPRTPLTWPNPSCFSARIHPPVQLQKQLPSPSARLTSLSISEAPHRTPPASRDPRGSRGALPGGFGGGGRESTESNSPRRRQRRRRTSSIVFGRGECWTGRIQGSKSPKDQRTKQKDVSFL